MGEGNSSVRICSLISLNVDFITDSPVPIHHLRMVEQRENTGISPKQVSQCCFIPLFLFTFGLKPSVLQSSSLTACQHQSWMGHLLLKFCMVSLLSILHFEYLDAYVFQPCVIIPSISLNQEVFLVFFFVTTLPTKVFDVLILFLIEFLSLDMLVLMRMYFLFLLLVCNPPLPSQILLSFIIPPLRILLCLVLTLLQDIHLHHQ
jgi:hypothetical protein